MSDKTTLLPCSMCGAAWPSVQVRWIGFTHTHNGAFSAGYRGECCDCGLTTRAFDNEDDAANAWNTRVTHGMLTAEQVREAIERHSAWVIGNNRCFHDGAYEEIADELNAELGSEINGDTSDGYHTFNELYHHRAVLFSVIVRDHRELAWKARKHYDGTMYDGMFIVGIETPKGQATYHYDLDPYWEMFDCEERESAPEWDGHTPDEAIARIAGLSNGTCELNWVLQGETQTQEFWRCECGNCGGCFGVEDRSSFPIKMTIDEVEIPNFCPNCGWRVVNE